MREAFSLSRFAVEPYDRKSEGATAPSSAHAPRSVRSRQNRWRRLPPHVLLASPSSLLHFVCAGPITGDWTTGLDAPER